MNPFPEFGWNMYSSNTSTTSTTTPMSFVRQSTNNNTVTPSSDVYIIPQKKFILNNDEGIFS